MSHITRGSRNRAGHERGQREGDQQPRAARARAAAGRDDDHERRDDDAAHPERRQPHQSSSPVTTGGGRESAIDEEVAAGLVGLVDAQAHGLHLPVGTQGVVALERAAGGQDVQVDVRRGASPGRARSGGAGRSRTRRARCRPPTTARPAASRPARPAARRSSWRPRPRACSMGIELTMPPSMKCSSPIRVGGKQPRHGRRREDRGDERPGVEDVLGRALDVRGDDLQRHREIFESGVLAEARARAGGAAGAGEFRWVLVLTRRLICVKSESP